MEYYIFIGSIGGLLIISMIGLLYVGYSILMDSTEWLFFRISAPLVIVLLVSMIISIVCIGLN